MGKARTASNEKKFDEAQRLLAEAGKLKEGMLVIGNESKGVSPAILALTYKQLTIPRLGSAESLNAAVATGILLSHLTSPSDVLV